VAKINCAVDSCMYWDNGNICRADEIWVRFNRTMGGVRTEFAAVEQSRKARTSAETCCDTFRPRDQGAGEFDTR